MGYVVCGVAPQPASPGTQVYSESQSIVCHLAGRSVVNLRKAWHLCLMDACTYWGCPWCPMAPHTSTPDTMLAMGTHLWAAHADQADAALRTMAPPILSPFQYREDEPPHSLWTMDYLEATEVGAGVPTIYHHAYPVVEN